MAVVEYDEEKLELAITDAELAKKKAEAFFSIYSSFTNVDPRIINLIIEEGWISSSDDLLTNKEKLSEYKTDAINFYTWLNDTYVDYKNTKDLVGQLTDDLGKGLQLGDANLDLITGGYAFALSEELKTFVIAALERAGFSEDEVDNILNNKVDVDKVLLDDLCNKLETLYNSDTSVRKLILEKYGFDIFNDDGTVIRDLAAIVLIMDGKNPDDDFDVNKLIADLTKPTEIPVVDKNENKDTNSEKENVVNHVVTNDNKKSGTTSDATHSGSSVSSNTLRNEVITGTDEYKKAVSEIKEIVEGDSSSINDDLVDASDNIKIGVTSVLRGKIPSVVNPSEHQDSSSVKSATAGVGSAFAGLATAAAISGGGITAVKKREKNVDNDEETKHVYENVSSSPATNENETPISIKPKWLEELDI